MKKNLPISYMLMLFLGGCTADACRYDLPPKKGLLKIRNSVLKLRLKKKSDMQKSPFWSGQ